MWQGSSVGQSMRFIPAVSRVQVSPLLPQCIYPGCLLRLRGLFLCPAFCQSGPLPRLPCRRVFSKASRFSTLCTSAPCPSLQTRAPLQRPYIMIRRPESPYSRVTSRVARRAQPAHPTNAQDCQQTRLASITAAQPRNLAPGTVQAEGQGIQGHGKARPVRSPDICASHACLKLSQGMH